MAQMPTEILIVGHTYKVSLFDKSRSEEADAIGLCDRNRLTIGIGDFLAPSKKAETLLHEVLHAATDAAGVQDEPADSDEKVVNPLARILFSVFVDNPSLLVYFLDPE